MGIAQWFRIKFRNSRRDARNKVHQEIKCLIQRKDKDEYHEAWVCDISKTGIGVLIRTNECDVGETIITHLNHGLMNIQSAPGEIVGQDIVYYGPQQKVENSFVRYSIRFEAPLPENELQRLRILDQSQKN